MEEIIALSDWKLDAATYTTDFEKAIINVCKSQFPEGFHVGCLFHLKQAWRRYLISEIGFTTPEIKNAMSVGALDLLTIILQDNVEQHGIPFLRTKFEDGLSEEDVTK